MFISLTIIITRYSKQLILRIVSYLCHEQLVQMLVAAKEPSLRIFLYKGSWKQNRPLFSPPIRFMVSFCMVFQPVNCSQSLAFLPGPWTVQCWMGVNFSGQDRSLILLHIWVFLVCFVGFSFPKLSHWRFFQSKSTPSPALKAALLHWPVIGHQHSCLLLWDPCFQPVVLFSRPVINLFIVTC